MRPLHPCLTVRAAVAISLLGGPVAAPCLAQEATDSVAELRREVQELRALIDALRAQVEVLRGERIAAPEPGTEPTAPAPVVEPAQPPAAPARSAQSPSTFNPAISAVLLGVGSASLSHESMEDGFDLSEVELGLQAAVDPYVRADVFVAVTAEGEAEIEEAHASTLALPKGLQVKGGRFKSAFGKWNTLHDHSFLTVDRPDALVSFFGEESLTADGASLSWLVPGTGSIYLESITELASDDNDVFFNARHSDPLLLEHLASVFTLGPNATLGLGLSAAAGKAGPSDQLREDSAAAGLEPSEALDAGVYGADVTYKWKPLQFGLYRSFTWQTEALLSRRKIEVIDPGGTLEERTVRSLGGYSIAEYQPAKRWRVGLRYDHTEFPDDDAALQRALSAVLRIQPSEFQEFRIQFKHTVRNDAAALRFEGIDDDNQLFVEWIPTFGAHGAHKY